MRDLSAAPVTKSGSLDCAGVFPHSLSESRAGSWGEVTAQVCPRLFPHLGKDKVGFMKQERHGQRVPHSPEAGRT